VFFFVPVFTLTMARVERHVYSRTVVSVS